MHQRIKVSNKVNLLQPNADMFTSLVFFFFNSRIQAIIWGKLSEGVNMGYQAASG